MKLHLVDGTYELFRSFYGAPSALSPTGAEVGATRGLLRSLLGLCRAPDVTHVGVAFDTVIESFRNGLFAGYKTGEGIEPTLHAQFALAERAAAALGLTVWSMREFEADDAIGTAVARFGDVAEVEQVVICSPDKDFAQCVSGRRVVLWDRMRDIVLDETGVIEKFGVPPAAIPDWLALVGDSADGIPGVPRWGAKSAAAVLAHYQNVDAIPDNCEMWPIKVRGAASLAASLQAHRAVVGLYKRLATLRIDAPVPQSLDALRWRGAHRQALQALCAELGDERFLQRVEPDFAAD